MAAILEGKVRTKARMLFFAKLSVSSFCGYVKFFFPKFQQTLLDTLVITGPNEYSKVLVILSIAISHTRKFAPGGGHLPEQDSCRDIPKNMQILTRNSYVTEVNT